VERIANKIKANMQKRKSGFYSLRISELVKKLFVNIQPEFIEDWKVVGFLKRAILGGAKDTLTETQFSNLLNKISKISTFVYDVIKLESLELTPREQYSRFYLYKQDIINFRSSLYFGEDSNDYVFEIADLLNVVEHYFPEMFSLRNYIPSLREIKAVFFDNSLKYFMGKEIYKGLDHLEEIVDRGYNFYTFYMNSQKKNQVTTSNIRSTVLIPYHMSDLQKRHYQHYQRITQNYKYFKGEKALARYVYNPQQDAKGIFEVGMIEYAVSQIVSHYGEYKSDEVYGYVLTQDILLKIIKRLDNFFVGHEILYPERIGATSEILTLLTTLFQNQSNGDSYMSVPEVTEIAHSFVQSFIIADDMYAVLSRKCSQNEKGWLEPDCFIREFTPYLYSEFGKTNQTLASFVPLFAKSLNQLSTEITLDETSQYGIVNKYQSFARTCVVFEDGEPVYVSKSDIFMIFAGGLSIEQAILRFDVNQNNTLEPNEVNEAFKVYKPAIEGLLPTDLLLPFTRKIYQYLVKYKKMPDLEIEPVKGEKMTLKRFLKELKKAAFEGSEFASFITIRGKRFRKANANRATYTSILQIISDESPESKANPFDCEKLKEPSRLK
jgi:hypothetical protein